MRPLFCAVIVGAVAGVPARLSAEPASLAPQELARELDASLACELFGGGKLGGSAAALAPRASDATFLRRAWLDIVGDIPTPEHVIAFTLDSSADKRQRAVRALLADPQYGLNWARYWRDVILYRRIEERALIAANALEADLAQRLNDNIPWNRIAREFITATGDVRDNGVTAIIMAQEGRTEETTAETARIFLGMQFQCAQCHDHPYDRWKREQFHELAAFFPRIGVRPVQSATRRSFQVLASDRQFRIAKSDDGNRPMPEHMMPDLDDPAAPGTEMQPKFFLTGAKLPTGSLDHERREALAQWLTENEWFAVALVNRIWAELVGEGFYEPVDDIGPDRQARAPATLKLLADGFRASGHDVKWIIETICATEAYQRESRPRDEGPDRVPLAANTPQPLRADQLYNALLSALDATDEEPQRGQARAAYVGRGGSRRMQFGAIFGYDPSEPRDAIAASIPQALALMNSPTIAKALRADKPGMLASLLADIPSDDELTAELYLRMLSRQPTADELARACAYIAEVGDRAAAVEDLAWALVNSAEFRYRR
ncbi:MAG: hypothetical protein DCC67_11710 [Planctomycetota bacterium]|nr:MAG: hypothetical protein DCC67_11710 [Planctomycetota bacterium]